MILKIIGLIIMFAGLLLLLYSYSNHAKEKHYMEIGIPATAQIIDLDRQRSSASDTHKNKDYALIEYTVDGEVIQTQLELNSSSDWKLQRDEIIDIFYMPDDIEHAVHAVDAKTSEHNFHIFVIISAAVVIIGFLISRLNFGYMIE